MTEQPIRRSQSLTMFGQASFMVAATTTLLGSTLGLTRSLRERGDAERVCDMPEAAPAGQPLAEVSRGIRM
ncbi:hypothetical protein [Rhodobacter sp. 24-YEA-8]|uniref:hypothetical protein n=1 Tax=Rhodobacter sp. 24-YEA-8 TaxID=1884310 RepID=UPI00089972F0|nr:hypothetical protein [Rhodobacter sp. 24-YEA-8]SEC17896.1 hypothetical protein SAMN05519105_2099 [Rhodobacter sp. 24-YEA-8]